MDIRKKKPRVINLRKKKVEIPRRIELNEVLPPVLKEWQGGDFPCIQCGAKEAIELGRCRACDATHQKRVVELDARPKEVVVKAPTPIASVRKEVSQGVTVTISTLEPLRG